MENNFLPKDWDEDTLSDSDTNISELEQLTVSSRDWTVETITTQIDKGNINLNPKFQRRNAWNDEKRSTLIESLIIGIPVPEIVLAESPQKKGAFIVIDGKQRLTSIIGFLNSQEYPFWEKPILRSLKIRKDLNGSSFKDFDKLPGFDDDKRKLLNQDIRCTIITNFKDQDVLYDIFYRLNTGSVQLNSQELRQVLNRGEFADYLIQITNSKQPLHEIMGLDGPDDRLRDIEIILRLISISFFGGKYTGNLRRFLDDSMKEINNHWEYRSQIIIDFYQRFNKAINLLKDVLGPDNVGRKFANGEWEKRFNKVLFEVQTYYFMRLVEEIDIHTKKELFIDGFKKLCENDSEFRDSIESSTKDQKRYEVRFRKFRDLVTSVYQSEINEIPIS